MKSDVYKVVTDRIIRLLEAGTVPWHRPWRGNAQAPQNLISRKAYRGINLFLLNAAGYQDPFWLSFKQVQFLGGRVKKGEQSWPVVFWKILEDAERNGDARKIPFLRYHCVFNVAQCEGIIGIPDSVANAEFQSIAACEQVVTNMPSRPAINHGGSRACYSPTEDTVSMPDNGVFESSEAYYSVLFHELTHSTGHRSRLGRKEVSEPSSFGSDPYCREELVAEMGAAFLAGHCGIESTTIELSASYIENWLGRLKDDRKLVVHAGAQAQKASEFILDIKHAESEGPVVSQPKEWKVVALRECAIPEQMQLCDTPQRAADYWRAVVEKADYFNPEVECLIVLHLNSRRRVKGHHLASIGILDTILAHPREVFRTAIVAAASAIVLLHNHPSGEPTPSEADVKITRDIIRAGQLLKMEVLDHVIIGKPNHCSLRELGHFYQ